MEVDGGEAPGSDHGTATGADETLGTAGLGSGGGHASRNCGLRRLQPALACLHGVIHVEYVIGVGVMRFHLPGTGP